MEESCLAEEIEVLEAIYIHELCVERNERGDVEKIVLQLHPATGDDVELQFVCMTLILDLPKTYPEEPPDIAIRNPRGIGEEEVQSLLEDMHLRSQERRGGAMLFELIELAKDSLTSGNIPHCACMICLEHFTEGDNFTKTECYHYFHQSCLSRYIKHALSEESKMEASFHRHTKVEEKKLICPVCREEIRDRSNELLETEDSEQFHFTPSEELQKMQASMADMLERQRAKGGIIDVEAEKNKFLIKKDDVVHLTSCASDPNLHGKDVKADLRTAKENADRPRSNNESRQRQSGKGKRERYDREKEKTRTDYDRKKERPQSGYVRGKGRGKRFDDKYHSDDEIRHRKRYDEKRDRKLQEDWRCNKNKYSGNQEKNSNDKSVIKAETKVESDHTETDSKVKVNICDESNELEKVDDKRIEESKVADEGKEKNDLRQKEAFNSGQNKGMKDRYCNDRGRKDDGHKYRRDDWRDRKDSRDRPEPHQSDRKYYKNDNRDNYQRDGNYRPFRDEQSDRQYRRPDNRNRNHRGRNYNPNNDRIRDNSSQNKCDTRIESKQLTKESEVMRGTEVKCSHDRDITNDKFDESSSDRKSSMDVTDERGQTKDLVRRSDDRSDGNYRDGSGKRYGRGRGRGKPRTREINELGFNDEANCITKGVQDLQVTDADANIKHCNSSHKDISNNDSSSLQGEKTNKTGQSKGPPGFKMRPPPGFSNNAISNAVTSPPPGF